MADKKADLIEWIKDNPPPEDITVTFESPNGTKTFHFKRSLEAYNRYVENLRATDDEGKPLMGLLAISSTVLLDAVVKDEREALTTLLNAYPGHVTTAANKVLALYHGDLEVKIKNVSTPAGP
jgi:DNA polymerase III delta subunit